MLELPNLVSAARVPLAVVFPFIATRPAAAAFVLLAAAVTDVLDGWLARRLGQATPTGALVDGVADKVFGLSVLVSIVAYGLIAAPLALLLATRELGELPLVLRVVASRSPRLSSVDRRANVLGKVATALELATVLAIVLRAGPAEVLALVAVTAAIGAAAALSYWAREIRASRARDARARGAHQNAYAP
jgi:CDP-diacylglycerol--glycerol-3-phosphate 3-phosphatidyltransferase/cardiolipin synthase